MTLLTCGRGAVEGHRTPSAGCLVHMQPHDKLVASVWTQVLNDHVLLDPVEEKRTQVTAFCASNPAWSLKKSEIHDGEFFSSSRLNVADGGGVVGAHR